MAITDDSKLRSRLGYLNYDEIQDRIDNGQLDQYDVVLVKDQDTAAFVAPDMSIHNITARLSAYASESTAIRALNADPTTYMCMPVAILHDGSYKLFLTAGETGNWDVIPAWGNETAGVHYDELIGAPVLNKIGTADDIVILNQLPDGIYAVKGFYRITDTSSELFNPLSFELVLVKENGDEVTRILGKDIINYNTSGSGEPSADRSATEEKVDEMIDEQFQERLEETSSESIQDLFN